MPPRTRLRGRELLLYIPPRVSMHRHGACRRARTLKLSQVKTRARDRLLGNKPASAPAVLEDTAGSLAGGHESPILRIVKCQIIIGVGRPGVRIPRSAGPDVQQVFAGVEHNRAGIAEGNPDRLVFL